MPCALDVLRREALVPDRAWEEARRICCEAVRRRLLPAKSLQIIAATSLYAACREFNVPVTIADLATAACVKRVEMGRSYKRIIERIGMTPPTPNRTRFTLKVASATGASKEATELALRIERKTMNTNLEDRKPMTIAAASVYLACLSNGEMVTQSDVAEAAGVSVLSVRECSKDMRKLVQLPGLPESE